MIAVYEKQYSYGGYLYKDIKLTGRWKLASGPYGKNIMYVEKRGLLFKSWVCEDNIAFKPARESHIFICNKL